MTYSFRTNGNFIDFVHTDNTNQAVESVLRSLHNTSRCVTWSLPEDTTRISFVVDDIRVDNFLLAEIDFDGVAIDSQDDFETGIIAAFPGLSGGGSSGSSYLVKTYAELVALINADGLVPGTLYKISDRGDRGLFFTAISVNQLAKDGTRLMLCPARYSDEETVGGNVWKGVWTSVKNPDVDDLMIWGGLVWKNLTGNIGTADSDIALDNTNWALIPKASFSNNEYIELKFGVRFDIVNDWIERQWDSAGNIFGIDFVSSTFFSLGFNTCDASDWNYAADNWNFNTLFDNTTIGVWNNSCLSIFSNKCNHGIFKNRNNGDIRNNNINGDIQGNSNNGNIRYNNNSENIRNNSNGGTIFCNNNDGDIANNTNGGGIHHNSSNGDVINNANSGDISNNMNNGFINGVGSANANIIHNTNNGDITTTTTGDITDPVVNK